jgi:hypothetical protein
MKRIASLLTLFALALPCWGQSVKLPETITGVPGQWIVIAPLAVDGGPVKYRFDPALQEVNLGQLLPDEMVSKLKGKVVTTTAPGRYKYEAWNAKGDTASDIAVGWVVILGSQPQPPVPVPPQPDIKPLPVPPPPSPAPIPLAGFRVAVIFEQNGAAAVLTKQQYNELYGAEVAAYLNAKCAKDAKGQPDWRIWNKDTPLATAPKIWQDVMARPRDNLPWIVISDGVSGFEGPLPDGGILNLLRKWGG